ncbi:MAG: CapA family protein [SAR324 cluster bacterium]|nr:CapA family protein [SAR324 cluster bacterium]
MPLLLFLTFFLLSSSPLIAAENFAKTETKALFSEAVSELKGHNSVSAILLFEKALKLEPENGHLHWELGWAYWQEQNWNKVVAHWGQTKKFYPAQKDLKKYLKLATDYQRIETEEGVYQAGDKNLSSGDGITITAVGDIMMGSDFTKGEDGLPPFRGTQLFAGTAEDLKGDLVFGNLEGPLTTATESDKCKRNKKCWAFRTPPVYAKNLKKAGFQIMNLANNHILDFGYKGLKETKAALKEQNIASFGTVSQPSIQVQVKGLKVAFIGVAAVSCCIHIDQIKKMKRKVAALKQKNDLVVVSFHAGAEGLEASHVTGKPEIYYGESRGSVKDFSHAMVDAGADLLLGHGPHTLRAMELYKDKLIVYSMGNFMGYLGFSTSGHLKYSMILQVQLDKNGNAKQLQVIPLLQSGAAVPSIDPKGRAISFLNNLGKEDFPSSAITLNSRGSWGKP